MGEGSQRQVKGGEGANMLIWVWSTLSAEKKREEAQEPSGEICVEDITTAASEAVGAIVMLQRGAMEEGAKKRRVAPWVTDRGVED